MNKAFQQKTQNMILCQNEFQHKWHLNMRLGNAIPLYMMLFKQSERYFCSLNQTKKV